VNEKTVSLAIVPPANWTLVIRPSSKPMAIMIFTKDLKHLTVLMVLPFLQKFE